MSVQDLTKADFDYWVSYASDMEKCHETEFMEEISPDTLRAFYRGKNRAMDRALGLEYSKSQASTLTLSRIFASANTIPVELYYKNPQPIVMGLNETTPEQAALMSALLRLYMTEEYNDAKRQNKQAVLYAWWMGLGWKKLGYRVEYEPKMEAAGQPESFTEATQNLFKSVTGGTENVVPMESKETPDLAYDEGLFNASESPLNVILDHKADLLSSRVILHRIPRTLYDLMVYGNYDEEGLKEAYDKFKRTKGSRFDSRSMDLVLKEMHIKQKNGIYVLSWIDGFSRPLQYERSILASNQKSKQNLFQFVPLYFTYEPGVRYPISHMKVAVQLQDKIDRIASLFLDIVGRTRNFTLLNKQDLEQGTIDAILQNNIGSVLLASKSINAGTMVHSQSPSVNNDIPTLLNFCLQNLTEIIGGDPQLISGRSENETLGQDQLAAQGTKVREGGMQDSVRDFMISQFKREGCLLHEYSEATLNLNVIPEDYADPQMRLGVQPQDVSFMTMQNPVSASSMLQGRYPGGSGKGEYHYDMNVEDAKRPDTESIQQGLTNLIMSSSNPEIKESLLSSPTPKRVRVDLMYEEYVKTFQHLGNPKRFLEDLTPEQVAAIRTIQMLSQGGGKGSAPKLSLGQNRGSQAPDKAEKVA